MFCKHGREIGSVKELKFDGFIGKCECCENLFGSFAPPAYFEVIGQICDDCKDYSQIPRTIPIRP